MKWNKDKIISMIEEANKDKNFRFLSIRDRYIAWEMGWYWFEMYIADTTITVRSPKSHSKWKGIRSYKKLDYVLREYR